MYNIQTLNKIAACGTDLMDKSKYAFGDDVKNPDAILVRSAAMHDMELGDNLLAIARAGAGTNNIPIDKCSEKGVVVFNTPGANANAVKELVIAALLMSSRKIPASLDWIKTLKVKGDEVGKLVEKGKSQFAGPEIMGKKLGVIGLGAIGSLRRRPVPVGGRRSQAVWQGSLCKEQQRDIRAVRLHYPARSASARHQGYDKRGGHRFNEKERPSA